MHIVLACYGCGCGGSLGYAATRTAKHLTQYCNVSIASNSFDSETNNRVERIQVTHQTFQFLRRFGHVPNEVSFGLSLKKNLLKAHGNRSIDFVIFYGHSMCVIAGRSLQKTKDIPYALSAPGEITTRPKEMYGFLQTAFYKAMTPLAYQHANVVLATSPYMAGVARQYGVRNESIAIIPRGIEPEDLGLTQWDPSSGTRGQVSSQDTPLKLIFVGRFSVEKGIVLLLEACRTLKEQNVEFRLQMIGDGALRPQIQEMLRKYDLNNWISLSGYIPRRELASHLRKADLFVMPSLDEPFGLIIVEALICGVPVLGSNTGGIPSIVQHGKNGLLFEAGSRKNLVARIKELASDRTKLANLSRNTTSSVYPRYSWDNIARNIIDKLQAHMLTATDKLN